MKIKKWCNYLVNPEQISIVNTNPSDLNGIAVYFAGDCHIYMLNKTSQEYYGMDALDSFNKYVLNDEDRVPHNSRR